MRRTRPLLSSVLALAVLSLTPSAPLLAQDDADRPPAGEAAADDAAARDQQARAVFELGVRAFEDGRYDEAVGYYGRAFELSGREALTYNLGVANERAGNVEEAIRWLERYLRAEPGTDRRVEVEERLRVLRLAAAQAAEPPSPVVPSEPAAPASAPATTEPDPRPMPEAGGAGSVMPFVLVGAGGAVLVTGAALLGVAAGARSTVEDADVGTRWSEVEGDADRADTMSLVGGLLLGLGLAVGAAGVVWLVAGGSSRAEVAVGPGGVAVRGSF